MRRRRILIVCMFDSIHAGRWLSQFTDQEIDFVVFPSKKFKRIHPQLLKLINDKSLATFSVAHPLRILNILGYLDFAVFIQIPKLIKINLRVRYLRKLMHNENFDYVHALEIQGAGYLCDEAIDEKNFKFILTNWGSDIFYFQHLPEHLPKIKSALEKADLYSAECNRDYKLALDLGFNGVQLPCIPNGGGLIDSGALKVGILTSERKNIVVKAYGGTFGRGALVIEAVSNALQKNGNLTAYFYSVTDDLIWRVEELAKEFGDRIEFSTNRNPILHDELARIFETSRIYIGCSVSDGISTSFLEALAKGVYPIQTNTSCAEEWINKGAIGSIVHLDELKIGKALELAIRDDNLVNQAAQVNLKVLGLHANRALVKESALQFYKTYK
jgi:hypothetical protein